MYKSILRPWLFRMDAEKIHGQIVALLHVYRHFPPVKCLLRAFYRPKATPFQWRNLEVSADFRSFTSLWR